MYLTIRQLSRVEESFKSRRKITISRNDGFGAQLQSIISAISYCELHALEYIHTPISSVEHNYDNDKSFESKLEAFINVHPKYRRIQHVKKGETVEKKQHFHGFFDRYPHMYTNKILRSIKDDCEGCSSELTNATLSQKNISM